MTPPSERNPLRGTQPDDGAQHSDDMVFVWKRTASQRGGRHRLCEIPKNREHKASQATAVTIARQRGRCDGLGVFPPKRVSALGGTEDC